MGLSRGLFCAFIFLSLSIQLTIGPLGSGCFAAEINIEEISPPSIKLNLFNTQEIRGSLDALKSWKILTSNANKQVNSFHTCANATQSSCPPVARSWLQMENTSHGKTALEKIKWVNHFFNRWPYRLDLDVYNQRDYWATPEEFMKRSGDCEDYSISKYFALRSIGFPAASLRVVILKDKIRNLGHAVLAVKIDSDILILDNLSDMILTDTRYTHYQPQYSLNENYRWAHIRRLNRKNSKPLNDN